MKLFQIALCAASLFALLPACTGETLDVDDSSDGADGSGSPLVYRGVTNIRAIAGGTNPAPDVTLTLTSLTETSATGTLTFGVDPAPPLVPSEVYPPVGTQPFMDGFPFTIAGVTRTNSALSFHIDQYEVFGAWCAAQESLPQPEGSSVEYSCSPYIDADYNQCTEGSPCELSLPGHPPVTVPYAVATRCGGCACTADGCTNKPIPPEYNILPLALRFTDGGAALNGTIGAGTYSSFIFLTRE